MANKFAIYARVSTRDQLTGHSLHLQKKQAREYVQRRGGKVVAVYEAQESATRGQEERTTLQRMLSDAAQGRFDALVIQETTRLSRNLSVMLQVTEQLCGAGVQLHDFSGPVPLGTAEGEFIAGVKALAGRFSARQGVEKSLASREHVLKSGRIAAGRPPYGRKWDRMQGKFCVIPERRNQLRRVHELIVNRGCSANSAAAEVGMASSSLRKAIRQAALEEAVQHLRGKTYRFPCPPLLSREQQADIEACLSANEVARPKTGGKYLLQGLVRCAACRGAMTGQTSIKGTQRYSYYRHATKRYNRELGCVWQAPVGLLDDDVLTACANVVRDGKGLREALETALAQERTTATDLSTRLKEVEVNIQRSGVRLQRAIDTLVSFDEGAEVSKRLTARAKTEERLLSQLQIERDELAREVALKKVPPQTADAIAAQLRSLYWGSGVGPTRVLAFDKRREFVRTIVGRDSRDSQAGVYISQTRGASGTVWRYKLDGRLALAHNSVRRKGGNTPDVNEIRTHSTRDIKTLASLASGSVGIRLPQRIDYGQMRNKCSSGA